jgi:protein O-mannosyl-transferase
MPARRGPALLCALARAALPPAGGAVRGAGRGGAGPALKTRPLVLVLLAAMVFAAFAGVLRSDWVRLDDPGYVLENPHVNGGLTAAGLRWALTRPHGGNWHPLTSLSHMLDVSLFGLAPAGHHAVSLLFHVLNAVLLALVLFRLTGAWWRSVLVAALFALHPLRVESVAWVSERKDVLSGAFFLLTLEAYRGWTVRPSRGRYALVALGLALGLMSKPMLVTTPFVLVLLDVWPLGRRRGTHRAALPAAGAPARSLAGLVLEKWPLLLLAAASAAMTLRFQRVAGAVDTTVPLADRLANAAFSCWRYVGMTLWPARLSPHYDFAAVAPPLAIAAALAALAVTLLALWRLSHRSSAAVGWLWYLGMLAPVLGIVQVGRQAAADRYTYLPGIGLGLIVVWPLGAWASSRVRRALAVAVAVVVLAVLGVLTIRQVAVWKDTRTLYRHALRVGGPSVLVLNGLATACEADSEQAEAAGYLRRALALAPNYANTHFNLGVTLARLGDHAGAAGHFRRAAELAPWRADAFRDLGLAELALGDRDEARACFRRALRLQPDDTGALDWLGIVGLLDGRVAEGLGLLARADASTGTTRRPHLEIAVALLTQPGHDALAARHLRQALRHRPDAPDALNALAWLLATSPDPAVRDGAEAVRTATRAAEVTGGRDPNVLDTRAAALAAAGRFAEAVEVARAAGELAESTGVDSLAAPIRARLAAYRSGRAWVDSTRAVGGPRARATR